jgi:hypothetical protein
VRADTCKICTKRQAKRKEGKKVEAWTCVEKKEPCTLIKPTPTASNFIFGEYWSELTTCYAPSMYGFNGFDWVRLKLIVETVGFEWDAELFKRLRILESKYYEKYSKEE